MSKEQVQVKISLSPKLGSLLQERAQDVGVPVTQFVKHLIVKEVEEYPTFKASEWLEKKTKKALRERDKAVQVKDIHEFFKNL
jgi:hypothetical protein